MWREDGSSPLGSFADAFWTSLWAERERQSISVGLVSAEGKGVLAASALTQSRLIEGARAQ